MNGLERIDRRELLDAMEWLDQYYASDEGLARPDGLSLNGAPDFEGIAAWILDVYLAGRLAGLEPDACRENVMYAIQQTDEWRTKHGHPGTASWTPFVPTWVLDRRELLTTLRRLDVFYRSWNGLQRPQGLSLGGRPDFEGIAAWCFDVYMTSRRAQLSPEQAWDRVVSEIRRTHEWNSRDRQPVDTSSLAGKHLMGYQGWFATPGDGHRGDWGHWFAGPPSAENATFDLWPDTSEYFDSELHATAMTYRDGRAASLFSSHNERTVRRHFDWMADVGIDGVSLGRFSAGTVTPATRALLDHVVANVRLAAEASGRTFFVWYDVTEHAPGTFVNDLKVDWTHLVDDLRLLDSPRYLHHDGRPLVGIWGAGADGRPGSPAEWIDLISYFRGQPDPRYSATVLLGGARDWRVNAQWSPVFARADVVSAWTVSAFSDTSGSDRYFRDELGPDVALANARGQGYLPTVFPGFSWANLQRGRSAMNEIPRQGGRFYWRQVFNAIRAGADTLFTAMFDEVDEGTAMFKAASSQADVPVQGRFLALDADGEVLPSDWYLRLGGAAGRMLRGEIPLAPDMPIVP